MNLRATHLSFTAAALATMVAAAHAFADEAPPPPPAMRSPALDHAREDRRSTGKMVTGIILTSCGVVNGSVGAVILIASTDCHGDLCGFNTAFGASFAGLGAALVGIGIPLWVVGAADPTPEQDAAGPVPKVLVGPGTVGARWSF